MKLQVAVSTREQLINRYRDFIDQSIIQDFQRSGGRVHVATDGRPLSLVSLLYDEGQRIFSEKFVQETIIKWPKSFRANVILHGYGYVQRNKAHRACSLFDMIESVGRDTLIHRLHKFRQDGVHLPPILIQVNTGAEPQKSGYSRKQADSAIEMCLSLDLGVKGVMAIPPRYEDPSSHYEWLRKLADRHGLKECSMGMSDDYRIAIEMGATAIRVGRTIFGEK